jgi:hypothetical protein
LAVALILEERLGAIPKMQKSLGSVITSTFLPKAAVDYVLDRVISILVFINGYRLEVKNQRLRAAD